MDAFSLDGRTAVVTGASRGIGAAVASALDTAGARVALVARSEDDLAKVAAELAHEPLRHRRRPGRAGCAGGHRHRGLGRVGRVDILVNNAAMGVRTDSTDLDGVTIDAMLQLNVRNLLLLTTALAAADG